MTAGISGGLSARPARRDVIGTLLLLALAAIVISASVPRSDSSTDSLRLHRAAHLQPSLTDRFRFLDLGPVAGVLGTWFQHLPRWLVPVSLPIVALAAVSCLYVLTRPGRAPPAAAAR